MTTRFRSLRGPLGILLFTAFQLAVSIWCSLLSYEYSNDARVAITVGLFVAALVNVWSVVLTKLDKDDEPS